MQIESPSTGRKAEVNEEFELTVRAARESRFAKASREGRGFSWDSTEKDIDTGDTMLFVKNEGTKNLNLVHAIINGSNVICTWTVLIGTATTTPSGTTISSVSLNPGFSTSLATVTALSDETAVADGSIIGRIKTPVTNSFDYNLDGVILVPESYVQVNQITESTSGSIILYGYFDK